MLGVFSYSAVKASFLNYDRVLSSSDYAQSIFRYSRDRALVEVLINDQIIFRGILNDEATKEDEDQVGFTILGLDSILRRTAIGPGPVRDGLKASQAITNLLSLDPIARVTPLEGVEVDYDFNIENAAPFINKSVQTALDELLLATNSFAFVTLGGKLRVSVRNPRLRRTTLSNAKIFYSTHDPYARSPKILKINRYNNGQHRAFNSFSVNGRFASDRDYVDTYGLREKEITFDWITSVRQAEQVVENLMIKYRVPKREFEIIVRTIDATDLVLGDIIRVSYGPVVSPPEGEKFRSHYGLATYGANKYNIAKGSIRITPTTPWIVYAKNDDTKNFVTTLKLREYGTEAAITVIEVIEPSLGRYGEGRYGEAIYG